MVQVSRPRHQQSLQGVLAYYVVVIMGLLLLGLVAFHGFFDQKQQASELADDHHCRILEFTGVF